MSRLVDSDSGGQSEVLETLLALGATSHRPGVTGTRLARAIAQRYMAGHDAQFDADLLTVLGDLHTDGKVSSVSSLTDRVNLTAAGRASAHNPRPRPRRDPWRGR